MLVHTGCLELSRSQMQQYSIGTLSSLGVFIHAQMAPPCLVWTGETAAEREQGKVFSRGLCFGLEEKQAMSHHHPSEAMGAQTC